MRSPSPGASLDAAERALAAVVNYPSRAEAAALKVLSDEHVEAEAASVAERTVGLVAREAGHLSVARRRLARAIAIAESGGLEVRAVEARLSLALVLLQSGYPEAAQAELDKASERAPRVLSGQVLLQRALIHIRTGRFDEALDDSRRALPLLRRAGDKLNEARLLSNRGILHAYRNELGLAVSDLNRALGLYRGLNGEISAAQVQHNLGYVAALKGDVPAALRLYDEAGRPFGAQGLAAPALAVDRAELFLSVRLLPEARGQIEAAVAALEAAGNFLDLAEARLLLSQIALAQGDLPIARSVASTARRQFTRQGRSRWAELAGFVVAQSRWAAGTAPRLVAGQAPALAEALRREGWLLPSLECRLLGARAALEEGDKETASALLAGIDKRVRSGTSTQRVRAWHAEALGRFAADNRSGALSALRAGLAVADDHRATLGATELRVQTATDVSELAELGLELAFESKIALQVLGWSEKWRAGALRRPRVNPPNDGRLVSLLAALRETVARLEKASPEGADNASLAIRQRKLEAAIRERSRGAKGDFSPAPRLVGPGELRAAIGEGALVEYIERDRRLHVVLVDRKGFRLLPLGSVGEVETERVTLQFALSRLALRRSSQASLEAAAALAERSCQRLDQMLIGPLANEVEGRDLILVPTGALHALTWALLPSLRGLTMTVSPSAALWYARRGDRPWARRLNTGIGALLVAGPRVAHGAEEIRRIRRACYPRASVLLGRAATARQVASAFEGRRLAHVAAHGNFRADNPQFSSLELADGPLTVYDLERIRKPPDWIVLSACDAGRAAVHPGDELMGTSAALLALGTRAIVSSAGPVPDDGVSAVMTTLHQAVATGQGLARALAVAQAGALPPSFSFVDFSSDGQPAREALAAGALVCLGAG